MYLQTSAEPHIQPPAGSPVYNNINVGMAAPSFSVFSVGTVLSRTFSTLFKHPFVFIGLCVLAQFPVFIVRLAAGEAIAMIAPIMVSVLGLIIQGAVAYGVYEVLRGNAAQFGSSLSRGMARIISLIFGGLLVGACFVLILLVGIIGIIGLLASGIIMSLVVALPMILLMIFLWCKWVVFIPICVVERLGPIASLSRSSELTYSCRLKIFVLSLLGFTILSVVMTVTAILVVIHPIFSIVELLVDAVPLAFFNVMTAVIYYELRSVKEGVSIDSLANVFD